MRDFERDNLGCGRVITVRSLPLQAAMRGDSLPKAVFGDTVDETGDGTSKFEAFLANKVRYTWPAMPLQQTAEVSSEAETQTSDERPKSNIVNLAPLVITDSKLGDILQFPEKPNSSAAAALEAVDQRDPSITSMQA